MSDQSRQRWIIRYEGRIVYYPWSWLSLGALSAYVVDSPRMLRIALRRRRRSLLLAGFWAIGSFFWMGLSPTMLVIDAVVLYIVRRWELSVLAGSSVHLPVRLALRLIADHHQDISERLIQSGRLMVLSIVSFVFICVQFQAMGAQPPLVFVLALLYGITDSAVLFVIWRLQMKSRQADQLPVTPHSEEMQEVY